MKNLILILMVGIIFNGCVQYTYIEPRPYTIRESNIEYSSYHREVYIPYNRVYVQRNYYFEDEHYRKYRHRYNHRH